MSAEHTVSVADGMRVRHDALAHFVVKAGKVKLDDRLIGAEIIGGAVTTASVMYNRLASSGGTSWWNPATGETISKPKVMVLFRPQDILTGDQECSCRRCKP